MKLFVVLIKSIIPFEFESFLSGLRFAEILAGMPKVSISFLRPFKNGHEFKNFEEEQPQNRNPINLPNENMVTRYLDHCTLRL